MKVRIEIREEPEEAEVVIRCRRLNDTIVGLQNYISRRGSEKRCLSLMGGETEYFVPIEQIYFFETEGRELRAHTADKIFTCGYRLYELEELLPAAFMRISKSAIVNLDVVYSITRNLTASSVIEFIGSSKKTMVSRGYYKLLVERLKERRTGL
ncbi:MAG: LytTR family transcriptional regulator [Roseburia sp.]|nr:LytTR family transcriptional regulator [Roseburia sp.]